MTKEEFIKAYNKYPPNGWTRFAYRYFSTSTTPKNSMLRKVVTGILITLFICGMTLSIIGANYIITKVVTLAFSALLMWVVVLMLGAGLMNNIRTRRVAKELGISLTEYNNYAEIWIE